MTDAASRAIVLSLASHTNAGKTTLARTLLGRDVGEVRDEVHVTLAPVAHLLVDTPFGDRLELWDTPGFGDSVRLARRMARSGQALGWFMSEVWDRFRDRAFWSSQQAIRHVLDRSDVVLYLVNASEAPEEAAYLAAELEVLALTGKPVVAVLNQTGPPRPPAEEATELQRWRRHLTSGSASRSSVHDVIALDAFAGCWVREGALLDAIDRALDASKRAVFARLSDAWTARHRARWHASMALLAARLMRAAVDEQAVESKGVMSRLQEAGAAFGLGRAESTPRGQAMQALAERVDTDTRSSMDALIALHSLDGRATAAISNALAEHFSAREPLTEGKAALFGGMATGALAGLKADIATGGLTLGGGLLAGGVLGALGGAGIARGYNRVRGVSTPTLAWSDLALDEFVRVGLLGYLAVIHHGRGRGAWSEGATPAFWRGAVDAALAAHATELHAIWHRLRSQRREAIVEVEPLVHSLTSISRNALNALYPDTPPGMLTPIAGETINRT